MKQGIEATNKSHLPIKWSSCRENHKVCSIGPAACGFEELEVLDGIDVAQIIMCHRTREWHKRVTEHVRHIFIQKFDKIRFKYLKSIPAM
ncbi:hypothetical protein NC651_018666 [Populus alba x Populus x berolinensis]|nr:hypothetical protein NC651_018666 [Populus alba x Populus x berolinensis]